jgi:hypothetical protein
MGADQQWPCPRPAWSEAFVGAAFTLCAAGMSGYRPPVLLAVSHQLDGFQCRSQAQTAWLVDMARQAHGTGTTRVFVVSPVDQPVVVADYAWCMASVAIADLPERLRRGAGRYPQPVALLVDVITRLASLSDAIGCRALLVHTESEQARGFYEHLIPEFQPSPTDLFHLVLLLKDTPRTLKAFGT